MACKTWAEANHPLALFWTQSLAWSFFRGKKLGCCSSPLMELLHRRRPTDALLATNTHENAPWCSVFMSHHCPRNLHKKLLDVSHPDAASGYKKHPVLLRISSAPACLRTSLVPFCTLVSAPDSPSPFLLYPLMATQMFDRQFLRCSFAR